MSDAKPPREALSRIPSWIMVGGVVGCILTLTVQREISSPPASTKTPPPAVTRPVEPTPTPTPARPELGLVEMEELFGTYHELAVWRHGITEVAFWNPATNEYSIFVEVLKNGDDYFFRTLPALTRPINESLNDPNVPMRFTETEEARAARRPQYLLPSR